jgi:hypothetical protein
MHYANFATVQKHKQFNSLHVAHTVTHDKNVRVIIMRCFTDSHVCCVSKFGTRYAIGKGVAQRSAVPTGETVMIRVALAHNHFDFEHLVEVMKEMQKLGKPRIRVYHVEGNVYQAIEGCHRLRAAAALGITPDFDYRDADELRSEHNGLDYQDGEECNPEATIGSIGDWENDQIVFDD